MYVNNDFVKAIRECYRVNIELIVTQNIGFSGAVSQVVPVTTPEVSDDALYYAGGVNFTNANATVRIKSTNPNYEWMANNDPTPVDTPVHMIFGIATSVLPLIPLVQPFWLGALGTLMCTFTNSAAAATTGGAVTFRALRLRDKIRNLPWEG